MPVASDALEVIERQTAVLVRNFELLHRRTDIHDRLDRAGYLLLRTLAEGGPMDINTLAATLGLDPSTAGRQVAGMRAAGQVESAPAAEDRRRCVVTPTEEGLRQMEAVRRRRARDIGELLADWSEDELRTLGAVFDKYNRAVAARYLTGPEASEPRRPASRRR
ncbi:MarR family transcriptional regulator [Streptomyces sp. ICBB 8177]|nr:MarR family transcriptional regulator [Streptomyces sp. ICBB 8177]